MATDGCKSRIYEIIGKVLYGIVIFALKTNIHESSYEYFYVYPPMKVSS